ncbi:unnamed protein product [Lymnaea stagnalis]|uniref:BRCT domain-containing protein n=1 Tax=Lymnaea stagnalis TaxID=6523 RepID=A0AAV2HXT0_LYMST
MEKDHIWTYSNYEPNNLKESNIDLFVSDSNLDDSDSLLSWDLITGLPALKLKGNTLTSGPHKSTLDHEEHLIMSDKEPKSYQNPVFSASEVESDNCAVVLAPDTVSDVTSSESDKNVTVVDRFFKNDQKAAEGKITLTPAKHIRSLHLSGEPSLVPDTLMDSCDEIEATPTIIPDSPTTYNPAGLSEEDEELDDVVSFKQHKFDKLSSQGRAESQSFHLKLTPSQDDDEELSCELPTIQVSVTSPLKLKVQSTTAKAQVFSKKPLFFLQKPAASVDDVDINDESEGSMSVFKRVKSGNLTPQKTKRIREDSNDFLETKTLKRKLQIPGSSPSSKQATSGSSKTSQKLNTSKWLDKRLTFLDEGSSSKTSQKLNTSKWLDKRLTSLDEGSSLKLVEESHPVDSADMTLSYEYEAPGQIQESGDDAADPVIISSPEHEAVTSAVTSPHQQLTNIGKVKNISQKHEELDRGDDMDQMKSVGQPTSSLIGLSSLSRDPQTVTSGKDVINVDSGAFTKLRPQGEQRIITMPEATDHDKTASAECTVGPEETMQYGRSVNNINNNNLTNLNMAGQNPSTTMSQPKSRESQLVIHDEVFTKPSFKQKIKSPLERRTSFVKIRLRKKTPVRKTDHKSSSTDDSTCKTKPARPHKLRLQAKRKSKSSLDQDAAQDQPTAGQQVTTLATDPGPSGLAVGNKSENVMSTKSDTNPSPKAQAQSMTETTVHTDSQNIRKASTVNFSDTGPREGFVASKQPAEGPDVERRTVTRTVVMTYTVTLKTKTQVFNSKGELVQAFEKSEILLKNESESGPMEESHQTTEHSAPTMVSPSRTSSTMTTGDLADISSSSLSRTFSSGSKTSVPSLEAIPSSQVLPKQHSTGLPVLTAPQNSSDLQGKQRTTNQGDFEKPSSDPPAANTLSKSHLKRHSGGSTTGPDLFGTPNQSIIDRADSQLGQIVSSSNSTPLSHPLSPKSYQNTSVVANSGNEMPVKITDQEQTMQGEIGGEIPQRKETAGTLSSDDVVDETSLPHCIKKPSPESSKDNSGPSADNIRPNADNAQCSADNTDTNTGKLKEIKKSVFVKSIADQGDSADLQSTGFSLQGLPPSKASGDSLKGPSQKGGENKSSSSAVSLEISFQGKVMVKDQTLLLTDYRSKLELGAKVMGRWKDGFFYPGILNKIDNSRQKFLVKFDDGSQCSVKPNEIILAAALPVGQSVMVLTPSGFYEPGMVMAHSKGQETDGVQLDVIHLVERDDGEMQRCERKNLILSDDQAACLLSSVEGLSISSDMVTPIQPHPGDVSLDNLVDGKRASRLNRTSSLEKPSTSGLQTAATSDPQLAKTESEVTRSGRKRKLGPVATSTPTPKQLCRKVQENTPTKKVYSPLGSAVMSPSEVRKTTRRAGKGLFEQTSKSQSKLFEGMMFILTHIEKDAQSRREEKQVLEDSSLDTSTDENADIDNNCPLFIKEHIQTSIERGGGKVLQTLDDVKRGSIKNVYLVAAEHQRTVKYLKALAAGLTIVSHLWILHSVEKNSLQTLTSYLLPAGISLEKRKIMEVTKGCAELAKLTAMVVSKNEEFSVAWKSILTTAGCRVITKFPASASKHDPGVDVCVSDTTCPVNIVQKCKSLDVPLVSSEWVIQCLVNGHLVSYGGNKKYSHDFI